MSDDFEERISAAKALLEEERTTEAFAELRWLFYDPGLAESSSLST